MLARLQRNIKYKKTQIKLLEVKTTSRIKNMLGCISNRLNTAEEKNNELEDLVIRTIPKEIQKNNKIFKNVTFNCGPTPGSLILM